MQVISCSWRCPAPLVVHPDNASPSALFEGFFHRTLIFCEGRPYPTPRAQNRAYAAPHRSGARLAHKRTKPNPRYAQQPAVAAILKMLARPKGATAAEVAKARKLQSILERPLR